MVPGANLIDRASGEGMSARRAMLAVPFLVLTGACSIGSGHRSAVGPSVVLQPGASDVATLNGSGSTLATGVMEQWAQQYRAVAPGVTINFRAVDSRTATADLQSGAVDFGFSETPTAPGRSDDIAAVPSVATAVAVAYNLPGFEGLRLSGSTLAGIFAGSVTSWDSTEVAADNPGRSLPPVAVAPVNRSDPAGATLVLTQYLQNAAPSQWAAGSGMTVGWPAGTAVTGPTAMTTAIRQRAGAVGYTSLDEADAAGIGVAMIRNAAGRFVAPTADSIDTFLLSAVGTPQDLALKVGYDSPAPVSYPLSALSYLLVPKAPPATAKETALRNFLRWVLSEGQGSTERARAAPLPLPLLVRTLEALQSDDLRPRR